jgi:hypothetical protein
LLEIDSWYKNQMVQGDIYTIQLPQ